MHIIKLINLLCVSFVVYKGQIINLNVTIVFIFTYICNKENFCIILQKK